jgi:hypothetical protein
MVNSTNKLIDWSRIDFQLDGEPLAKNGLRKIRQKLETMIRPHVTKRRIKNAGGIILFGGQRHYLRPFDRQPKIDELKRVGFAIRSLQFLYGIDEAVESGDFDKTIRMACGFIEHYSHLSALHTWGFDIVETLATRVRGRQVRANTRLGKTALRDVPDDVLRRIYERHCSNGNGWLKATTADINRQCRLKKRVQRKTVSSELKRRGIVERST